MDLEDRRVNQKGNFSVRLGCYDSILMSSSPTRIIVAITCTRRHIYCRWSERTRDGPASISCV